MWIFFHEYAWPYGATDHLKPKRKFQITVNVLKFQALVACQKCLDKQGRPRSDCFWRSSLIRIFHVCYSDKQFVNSSHDYHHFISEQKERSVQNLWIITIRASAWDFQQCDILTSVDSDEPVQSRFKLRNSKWCSVSSLTITEYSSD